MAKYRNWQGWKLSVEPTSRGLVCGDVWEAISEDEGGWERVTLWQECPSLKGYHVRRYDNRTGNRDWRAYATIKEAKRAFRGALRGLPLPQGTF